MSLFVALGTAALCFGQAGVLRAGVPGAPRAALYVAVWAIAVLTMAGIAYQIFDLGHAPANARGGAIRVLLALAGIIAALALLAGARWGARGAMSSATLSGAAAALAGIHGAIVFFGGALGVGVFVLWTLARVRW